MNNIYKNKLHSLQDRYPHDQINAYLITKNVLKEITYIPSNKSIMTEHNINSLLEENNKHIVYKIMSKENTLLNLILYKDVRNGKAYYFMLTLNLPTTSKKEVYSYLDKEREIKSLEIPYIFLVINKEMKVILNINNKEILEIKAKNYPCYSCGIDELWETQIKQISF